MTLKIKLRAWERLKKQLLAGGRDEYKTYAKDTLIEMLLNRDKMLMEDLQKSHLKGELRLHPDRIQERIVAQVPYIVFKKKKEKGDVATD